MLVLMLTIINGTVIEEVTVACRTLSGEVHWRGLVLLLSLLSLLFFVLGLLRISLQRA